MKNDWTVPALAVIAVMLAFTSIFAFEQTFNGVIGVAIMQGLSCGLWLYAARRASPEARRAVVFDALFPIAEFICMTLIWGLNTLRLHSH